jgi:hypothetical protein
MNKTKIFIVLLCLGAGILGGLTLTWGSVLGVLLALTIGIVFFPKHIGATGTWLFCLGAFLGFSMHMLIHWEWAAVTCAVLGGILHYAMYYRQLTPEQRRS